MESKCSGGNIDNIECPEKFNVNHSLCIKCINDADVAIEECNNNLLIEGISPLIQLKNLLAVIHRDGGHYTEKYGINKSINDATQIVANLIMNPNTEGKFCELNNENNRE